MTVYGELLPLSVEAERQEEIRDRSTAEQALRALEWQAVLPPNPNVGSHHAPVGVARQ